MSNKELKELVLYNLPVKDSERIVVRGYQPKPTTSQNNYAPYIDVTKQVKQLLKEGKIKRIREYGYGHSGNAGNTFFVLNNP